MYIWPRQADPSNRGKLVGLHREYFLSLLAYNFCSRSRNETHIFLISLGTKCEHDRPHSLFPVPDGYSGYLPPPSHHQQQQAYHLQTAPQQFAAPPAIPTPVIQAATSSVSDELYMLDIGFPPRTKKKMKKPKSGEPGAVKRKSREGEGSGNRYCLYSITVSAHK